MGKGSLFLIERRFATSRLDQTRSALSLSLGAAVFAVLACLALIGLEGWNAWADRSARLQQIETNATNLAQSLARQTSATINLADTVLVDLVERLETEGVNSPVRSRLDRLLAKHAAELPDRTNFFVYGEEGEWLASSLPSLPTGFNNADREYFQHHRASGERGAYLGAPVRSRSEGNWIIPVSRRFQVSVSRSRP